MQNTCALIRENWIDSVKGLGIIFVMMLHSCGMPTIAGITFTPGIIPVFFVVAGITFKLDESIRKGLLKKVKRLLIPYVFYSLITIILSTIYNGDYGHFFYRVFGIAYGRYFLFSTSCELNNILMMDTAPMWFLPAMFLSFVWLHLFFAIKGLVNKVVFLVILVIVPFLTFELPYLLPWSIDTSTIFTLFMLIGVRLKSYFYSVKKKYFFLTTIYVFLSVFVFFAIRSCNGGINLSIRQYGDLGIISIVILFVLGVLESFSIITIAKLLENTIIVKILSFVGKHSMRLMCIHYFLFLMISNSFGMDLHNTIDALLLMLLALILSIIMKRCFDCVDLWICRYL